MQAASVARLPLPTFTQMLSALGTLLQRTRVTADAASAEVAAAKVVAATSSCLDHGHIAWVEHPAGRTIACEAGALWITFDGQQLDVVLKPGQSYYCRDDARMGIYAVAPSRFSLDGVR